MAKKKPEAETAPVDLADLDLVEIITAITGGGMPVQALDPATALFNFGSNVCMMVGKIIDTVPEDEHDRNWERLGDFLDLFKLPGATPGAGNIFKRTSKPTGENPT